MPISASPQEQERLKALQRFAILDTEKERTFDMITQMLAQMLGVPHACVSLVDRERVWFKSAFGVDAPEVPREAGFCTTLAQNDESLRYIEDASVHPETKNNSLVHGGPEIRFYAGAPLCTEDGHRIGTLCAFGPEPRGLDEIEAASLINMTTLVMHEIDLRRTRQELQRTEEALAASQRLDSLGLLASGVAHDFNNLLCAILGNTELLRDELGEAQGPLGILQEIEDAGRRASDLAEQVLAYAGGEDAPMAAIDFNEIVSDTYRVARSAFESRVHVELHLAQGLPPAHGESTAVRQVVLNLLLNAVQACDLGGGEVRVETLEEGDDLLLRVSDTGPGMCDETRKRLFEPFFSNKPNGRGLGLAICKRIIDQHGGSIEIDSVQGEGTSAVVRLPRSSAACATGSSTSLLASKAGGGGSVLLVDDERAVLTMAQASLEKAGYKVVSAEGGQEALDLIEKSPGEYSAVVLDWSMPFVNGDEVLRILEERNIELPVVLSSGHSKGQADCMSSSVVGFLKKPYSRAELVECVNEAIGVRG